jgi:hypothetical protein
MAGPDDRSAIKRSRSLTQIKAGFRTVAEKTHAGTANRRRSSREIENRGLRNEIRR